MATTRDALERRFRVGGDVLPRGLGGAIPLRITFVGMNEDDVTYGLMCGATVMLANRTSPAGSVTAMHLTQEA